MDFFASAQALFPYLPGPLLQVLVDAWIESDDLAIALQQMRQSSLYDTYYPGNRRDDGTLRFDEQGYAATVDAYATTLRNFGVDPEDFKSRFVDLITGEVDAREFASRIESLYMNIMSRGESIRQWYADNYGNGNISDAALLASALDPSTDPLVFEQRYRTAQIGGVAASFGFERDLTEVQRLADFGLDQQAAISFFSKAQGLLPTLGTLVARHNDPDDEFDLSELEDAVIFANPTQVERMNRLFANEASLFSPIAQLFRTDQDGSLTGLRER